MDHPGTIIFIILCLLAILFGGRKMILSQFGDNDLIRQNQRFYNTPRYIHDGFDSNKYERKIGRRWFYGGVLVWYIGMFLIIPH